MKSFRFLIIILGLSIALGCTAYAATEVTFTTSDGYSIYGTFYEPAKSPAQCVLLLHMLGSDRSSWDEFASKLQTSGFAVLTIDFRGHGQSIKSTQGEVHFGSFKAQDFSAMIFDASAAMEWLKQRSDIIQNKIAICGASIGANIALNYAVIDTNISCLVLMSPGLDYRGVLTEPTMSKYGTRPVLFIAAEDDSYSAVAVKKLNELAIGAKKLLIYEKGGHGTYLLESQENLVQGIIDFLLSNSIKHDR